MSAPRLLVSQERGAIALGEAVLGLGVNTRVLMIGAHPDDEDTFLIAWLSRGRHVSTAYLSLTRGDGGQNLIGNELGEALGVIRTEELLAARRIDGADQYFTRAYDFGFSKDTIDTYAHWPKDSILGDVIRVVRAFRPHVIVAVFSGTPRDGHGQHQVSGLLAREAYDISGDTVRFPAATHGDRWVPSKFYRVARGNQQSGTLGIDVGEYSPLFGRSYAEIAGESRSQHKSQGFGALQRKGPVMNYVRREATRVNAGAPASNERSLFDGIDTSWARFRPSVVESRARAALDSLPITLSALREAFDPLRPERLMAPLHRVNRFLTMLCPPDPTNACEYYGPEGTHDWPPQIRDADLQRSRSVALSRVALLFQQASGMEVEVNAARELYPRGDSALVVATVHNRGRDTLLISNPRVHDGRGRDITPTVRRLVPHGVLRDTIFVGMDSLREPSWRGAGRSVGMFHRPASARAANIGVEAPGVAYIVERKDQQPYGPSITLTTPVIHSFADDVRGEVEWLASAAPAVSLSIGQDVQYAGANAPLARSFEVVLRSADEAPREVRVSLALPAGLTPDSATRTVRLDGYDAQATVTFRARGRIPAGEHRISARAESNGETFSTGYQLIDYDHIRRQRIYRPAEVRLSAVDVRVPATLRVGYIAGVSDNVAPALAQLGIPVTVIPAADLARTPLSGFTTLVIGPRAYEASEALVAVNARILDFARRGGTVVAQYGQYEMTQPGLMPYPITIARPHDRVTHEDTPVAILDSTARELSWPNRIGAPDFAGWVQERALYMPRSFDATYRALLAMNDPSEAPNRGGILVARLGQGRYIYTTLAFFRQLPAGVPGAARLFVNLLSAGLPTAPASR